MNNLLTARTKELEDAYDKLKRIPKGDKESFFIKDDGGNLHEIKEIIS